MATLLPDNNTTSMGAGGAGKTLPLQQSEFARQMSTTATLTATHASNQTHAERRGQPLCNHQRPGPLRLGSLPRGSALLQRCSPITHCAAACEAGGVDTYKAPKGVQQGASRVAGVDVGISLHMQQQMQ